MYLFIDTETSGLPDFRAPPDHPSQPHIVSLAAWLGAEDETAAGELQHVASLNAIIRPTDWHIDPRAEAVHKISEEYARSFGEPLTDVLARLTTLVADAFDDSPMESMLVAHNLSFDLRMLMRDAVYCGRDPVVLNTLRPFCTMKALTPRMRLPPRHGAPRGSFKWPKLDEAYYFLFARPVPGREDRHDAMSDVLGCKDIYEEGRRREWW